ncbi:villin-1 isoform X1 [Cinnamomum micranthum f. kanehirae]|uniref:Villin-1 isoform X1 n=1 Tax=Cinnamomum micranthum f. kanehirae TaxID=337451 RepID=A0A3S4NLG6_9MAGN|nr:villin-1 isoform X1 [Cinnamomum micranthum f. kanehirae]
MPPFRKDVDATFQGAGAKPGLEIWCIENLQLTPVPKSSYGKFFSGSSYVILNTVLLKSGLPQHDIHYWSGKDAKEVDSAFASDKAVELDSALGSHCVQYREVQGNETEKFLSYFKPCIIPIEGVFSSEQGHSDNETYKISLLACKGDHVVHVNEVPFSRSSLNHNDVFILDTKSKIFLFSGCNSTMQERAKALEVIQYIKDNKHSGRCEVATIEDGKFVGDSDVGEFWSLFGGYAPISRDSPSAIQKDPTNLSEKLFWINKRKMFLVGPAPLKKEMLNTEKCYMLDCGTEIFIWMGRNTSLAERKMSISVTEDTVASQGRSSSTHITFLTEGSETATFRSYFDDWPQTTVTNLYEEGRGKVAAIFKQQGFDVKELPDEDHVSQPFIDCSGVLKVWRVDCHNIYLVPVAEQGKLFSGDCYIVQYIYPGDERDEYLFYVWMGHHSIMEDRTDGTSLMCSMVDSIKTHPVMAQIFEGKEPIQFPSIFQKLIVFKGGMSSGYKRFIYENGSVDETYDGDKTALFRVQGSGPENLQAIQVDLVSGSLNSSYCYILQAGASIYTWVGNLSSVRDHDLLDRMVDQLYPTQQTISVREGSEPDLFWDAIGGKAEYPREKEIKEYDEDPHLFTCTFMEGDFKVKEVFNYTQDDLTTEEVLILDCYNEIYVWVGQHSSVSSKQQALTLGKKYLESDILLGGLSLETAIYVITEGHEPSFFTRFFEWDSSKAFMHGNSFERKLAILKGLEPKLETPKRGSRILYGTRYSETTSNGSRSKSIHSDVLRPKSGSPASRSVTPSFADTKNRRLSCPAPVARKLFPVSSPDLDAESPKATDELSLNLGKFGAMTVAESEVEADSDLEIFPYERLKVTSDNPIKGINVTKREAYLSNHEFQEKTNLRWLLIFFKENLMILRTTDQPPASSHTQ